MSQQPDLLWTFTGNLNDQLWVTRTTVLDKLAATDPATQQFADAVLTGDHASNYLTKQDILQGGVMMNVAPGQGPQSWSPDDWWTYFQMQLLDQDMSWADATNSNLDVDLWHCSVDAVSLLFQPVTPCGSDVHLLWQHIVVNFDWFGARPYEVVAPFKPTDVCPPQACTLVRTADQATQLAWKVPVGNGFAEYIIKGTLISIREPFLQPPVHGGGMLMPIPPIPTDLPAPPVLQCPLCPAGTEGPPGPSGPAGQPQTIQGFIDLLDTGTAEDIQQIDETLHVYGDLNPMPLDLVTVAAETLPDGTQLAAGMNFEGPGVKPGLPLRLPGEVTITTGDDAELKTSDEDEKTLLLLLALGAAGLVSKVLVETKIPTFDCFPDGTLDPLVLESLAFVTETGEQQTAWKLLFRKLDHLLRCCPPCENTDWQAGIFMNGFGRDTSHGALDAIKITEIEVPDGIDAWKGDPDKKRYGQMQWINEDGTLSDPISILLNNQIERAPTGTTSGFAWRLNPGVQMFALYRGVTSPLGTPY